MTVKMKIKVAAFLFLISVGKFVFAQYSLTELGVKFGGGVSNPLSYSRSTLGPQGEANGFLTHYFCGRASGFHMEAGYKFYQYGSGEGGIALVSFPSLIDTADAIADRKFQFHYLEGGLYYKLRRHDYHRDNEGAILFGPKINVLLSAAYEDQINGNSSEYKNFSSNAYRTVNRVLLGWHISWWVRREWRDHIFFIQPAIEYYQTPNVKTISLLEVDNLAVTLNFGIGLWNDK